MSCPAVVPAGRPGPSRSSARTPGAGCEPAPSAGPMPRRSATPGRKPSMSASAVSASRSRTSAPPGLRRSRPSERRPRPIADSTIASAEPGRQGEPVDADHLRAEIGQQHPEERHRSDRGQFDDPHALQRPRPSSELLAVLGLLAQQRVRANRSPYFSVNSSARATNAAIPPGKPLMYCSTPPVHAGKPMPMIEPMLASAVCTITPSSTQRADSTASMTSIRSSSSCRSTCRRVTRDREDLGQARPQAGALARLVVVEEARTAQASRPAELDHLLDDRLGRVRPAGRGRPPRRPCASRCGS